MGIEKTFSVYLFLSYRNLASKIADYAYQLGYPVYDGFATQAPFLSGIAIVDDQISSESFHQLMKHIPILAFESHKSPVGPCELISTDLSLPEFAKTLACYVARVQTPDPVQNYWLAHNPSSQEVHKRILLAAQKNCAVLIQGESGTGKEVVAQSIHQKSLVKGLFVAVNCGAIPHELVESELFGHEKGAFTGAVMQKMGKCEVAASGTLFLDEIGDMPLATQVKLLRVLQEFSFERLGSARPIPLCARIMSATHQPLLDLVSAKHFRQDLFYRLNVLPIQLLPLRAYPEELPSLMAYLIAREHLDLNLNARAQALLQSYSWPGNVRQLINMLKRMDIFYGRTQIGAANVLELLKFEPDVSSVGPSFAS